MASVNKVMLLGNVGKDPEIRYTPGGVAITNLSLATSSKRKDKNTGETIEETQWHRLVFYDRLAEIVGEYIIKGSSIFVEGRLKYGQYNDKDGVTRYTTDIVVEQMQMLGSKDRDGKVGDRSQGGGQNETRQQARQRQGDGGAPGPQSVPPQQPRGSGGSGFDDMDDDIPF